MKKSFMYFMLVFAILFGGVASVGAQSKALAKDVKKRVKELKKEGWTMQASTSTMDYALLKYRTYMEEDEDNRIAINGIAEGKNLKIGRENATMFGISNYAGRAKAQIQGKLKGLLSADNKEATSEETDRFAAAYEMGVAAKIGGLVKQHFVLVRDMGNGKKEFNVFMSLDESKARKAREEAAETARQKAGLADLSQDVKDFIGEPIEPEE